MQKPTTELEKLLNTKGYKYVIGLDEAGRGPWAGPLSTGAVVLKDTFEMLEGVADSKKLTEKKREELFENIKSSVLAYGIGIVTATEIDTLGVSKAVNLGMLRAIQQVEEMLGCKASYLIIDGGTTPIEGYPQQKINKGDLLHYSISAASILAKVTRDRIMYEYAKKYPEYAFESHVGYGTAKHMDNLKKYGPCILHRVSYKPIQDLLTGSTKSDKEGWKYWEELRTDMVNRKRIS
jgi:ribonuclease HII